MYDEKRRNGELAAAREDGIAEGRAEGLAQGHAEGLAEGRAEGRAEGLAEGHAEGRAETVRMMLAAGIPVETIAGALGISVEECDGYRNM